MIQRFELAVLLVLACCLAHVLVPPANAQSAVQVIGPIIPGDCVQWFSTTQIKDPGITCNGGAGSSPGGSNGQIQYNNAGTFGGLTDTQVSTRAVTNPGYTPPGTGAVATTPQAKLNRFLYANDYGAVCDGSTDDSTAFQNLINAAESLNLPAIFQGSCFISTGLSITSTISFGGIGNGNVANNFTYAGNSQLIAAHNINAITITTINPVNLHDFGIAYKTQSTGGAAITVTASGSNDNYNSIFNNIGIAFANIGFDFIKAITYYVNNCNIWAANTGFHIQETTTWQNGDQVIQGCTLSLAQTTGVLGVLMESSGGLRFINNKVGGGQVGFFLDWNGQVGGGDLFIIGNSFEGQTTNGVFIQRQGGTSTPFQIIIISGNEIFTDGSAIAIPTDAGGVWITAVNISNNILISSDSGGATFMIDIDGVNGLTALSNTMWLTGSATVGRFRLNASVSNATIGLVSSVGPFGSNTVTCSGTITCVSPF